ncbi:MAG: SPOR domain-containing protein [Bacteroidales bacterium]|nr:SPOR domain-containing protein [Bacteroidales bacterium]
MITIARHIELLLLDHDCVIVPGVGGFIANHVEAKYCGEIEPVFLPPYRTIGFNQRLKVNDGLLVQSYMTAYDASYPAAHLQMEKDIEDMVNDLEMTGAYELNNIGVVKKGLNNNITFTPVETGVLSPALYGLYSYEIESLEGCIKKREAEKSLQIAAMNLTINGDVQTEKKPNDIVIRMNRHWLDFAVSVAAAALLFFCFSYTAMRNINQESDTIVAAFYPMPNKQTGTKSVSQDIPAKPIVSKEKQSTAIALDVKDGKPTEVQEASFQEAASRYTIVLASYVEKRNAEEFIANLAKEGFPEARFTKTGKVSRVLYSGFANEEEARNALRAFREKNQSFSEAWVLEL